MKTCYSSATVMWNEAEIIRRENLIREIPIVLLNAWTELNPSARGLASRSNLKEAMKIKVPSQTVEACDICEQPVGGGLLTKCVVCGKEYCSTCEAIMIGCVHQPDVCKKCAKHAAVKATVDKFAAPLMAVLRQRNSALVKHRRRVMPNEKGQR